MLIQFVVALSIVMSPHQTVQPITVFDHHPSLRYQVALAKSTTIQAQLKREVAGRAEAARIQVVTDAEATAQRVVALARVAATPQPARQAPPVLATIQATRQDSGLYLGATLRAALAESPWPPELWATVERIVPCESGGNPRAVSPGGHVGLMQADPRFHGAVPADAVAQLTQAYAIYLKQGWGAWSCY